MYRRLSIALMLTVMSVSLVVARAEEPAAEGKRQTVGLVLSGGGAKGIAEVGAIQAFEENDIPIDYITGTSMGAIVGGLYAAGYSPQEMMQLLKSKMFLNASTGTIGENYYYQFFRPEQRPTMVTIPLGNKDAHKAKMLPSSLISPMPMNFSFMSIFAGHTAQCGGDFDRLFVPLRTVASDMTHKHKVVFGSGPLDDAVRASMSFPIVFKPIVRDGAILYDGGIYDNFPFDVMKTDFNPDIMIGVDIHDTDTVKGFPDVLEQMDILVIRNTNDYDLPEDYGIKVRINLNKFGLLDFTSADEIYNIGYTHALAMVDSIKSRVTARRPAAEVARRRAEFNSKTPDVFFDTVTVKGATHNENRYLSYLFKPEKVDTFGLATAMDAYTQAISTGQIRDLEPQAVYNPRTGLFSLDLQADVKENWYVSMGGYITSSVNSMLFLSSGYRSLSFRSIDASVNAWVGQSYLAGEISARAMLRNRQSSSIGFQGVLWRQKFHESDKLFYDDSAPAFITKLENFYRLKYSIATGRHSTLDFGVAYGRLDDRFYNNDETLLWSDTERNKLTRDLGQVMVKWERTSLDDAMLPTSGLSLGVMAQGVWEHYDYVNGAKISRAVTTDQCGHVKWAQLEVQLREYCDLGKHWSLGVESNALVSTRSLLNDYNASLVNAPAFNPTPASYNVFNPDLRANSFITAGLVPVYKISDRIEVRCSFHCFMPARKICEGDDGHAVYGKWFRDPEFYGEISGALKLPIGNLKVFGNYQTSPGDRWGVGIAFGYFILAPRMTRL